MLNPLLRWSMVCVAGGCLLSAAGCYSAKVTVGNETDYQAPPPPPPRSAGPPPWAPAHGYRAKHHYYYYPSSHVYYDTGRSLYFYYSGGKWTASVSLPAAIRIDVNDYVTLEMGTHEPYRYHTEVAKRYPPGLQKKAPGKSKGK